MTPVDLELFENSLDGFGARGALGADLGSAVGDTTLTFTTGHGARFPAVLAGQRLRLQIEDEIVVVTAHTASVDTATILRGEEGTTRAAHASGVAVNAVLTAEAVRRWAPSYLRQPRHYKYLAWSGPPDESDAAWDSYNNFAHASKIVVPETITIANLIAMNARALVTPGSANNWGAVYLSNGTKIGDTADMGTAWGSLGLKIMALTVVGGQSLTVVGGPDAYVYGVLLSNASTRPQWAGKSLIRAGLLNGGLAAADGLAFANKSAVGSTLPATLDFSTFSDPSASENHWMALT